MSKEKTICFYSYMHPNADFMGYRETLDAIGWCDDIHTTQMCLLNTTLLVKGFRIFVYDNPSNEKDRYEIKLGRDNERTSRDLKVCHNLYKLWANDEFTETRKN